MTHPSHYCLALLLGWRKAGTVISDTYCRQAAQLPMMQLLSTAGKYISVAAVAGGCTTFLDIPATLASVLLTHALSRLPKLATIGIITTIK